MYVLLGEESSKPACLLRERGESCIVFLPEGAKDEAYPEGTIIERTFEGLVNSVVRNASLDQDLTVWTRENSAFYTDAEFKRMTAGLDAVYKLKKRSDYTTNYWRGIWEANAIRNLPRISQCQPVDIVSFPKKPAIIVGPGPSLKDNISILKKLKGKVLIIALQRAFKTLTKYGVTPNVVVTLDAGDLVTKHYEGCPVKNLDALVLDLSVCPDLFSLPAKNALVFAGHGGPIPWLYEFLEKVCFFPSGCTVASTGVALAMTWQCDPIITVGVDLARSDGKRYAEGKNGLNKDELPLPSYDGKGVVMSELDLVGTHSWLLENARLNKDINFFNCSVGGARIPGFRHKPLKQVAKLFENKKYNFSQVFNDIPAKDNNFTKQVLLSDLPKDIERKLIDGSCKWEE